MINKHLRLTAGLLAAVLTITTVPAEMLAGPEVEESEYIMGVNVGFSAGAHSAINETVVLNKTEDDSLLADGNTGVTENETPTVADPEVPEEEPIIKEGPYGNMAIANLVTDYLNVRQEPNTESAVVGKIYPNNAAVVEEVCGEWYRVTSGNIHGYIHGSFVTVGDEALCKSVSKVIALVTVDDLRLRKGPSTDTGVHCLLAKGKKATVLDQSIEGWIQVQYGNYTGYISSEFAEVSIQYTYGETREEEAARLAAERAAAEEAARREEEERRKQEAANKNYRDPNGNDGQAVVDYALQFVGNPYVWGGESLTHGVDCSGYVMKIYEKFGYKLPHSSYQLRFVGRGVSESEMRPGDLVCYNGHVAIYIGDGKIVHAANNKQGIIVSNNWKYTRVLAIRRIIG